MSWTGICGIYRIYNIINNKSYIGQSRNIKERWYYHKLSVKNESRKDYTTAIHTAIRKYGLQNFKLEILEECPVNKLNSRERYWIKQYNAYNDGYNETKGGKQSIRQILLTKKDVTKIKRLLKTSWLSVDEIAAMFHCCPPLIRKINAGKAWYANKTKYPIRDAKKSKFINTNITNYRGIILQQLRNNCVINEFISYSLASKLTYGYEYNSHIREVTIGKRAHIYNDVWVIKNVTLDEYRRVLIKNYIQYNLGA